jgi:hypothetical protein
MLIRSTNVAGFKKHLTCHFALKKIRSRNIGELIHPCFCIGAVISRFYLKIMYAIEISSGSEPMWVAAWEGDPPRTLKLENAQTFKSEKKALKRIEEVRTTHPFRVVEYKVVKVSNF